MLNYLPYILFALIVVTGPIWWYDTYRLAPQRRARASAAPAGSAGANQQQAVQEGRPAPQSPRSLPSEQAQQAQQPQQGRQAQQGQQGQQGQQPLWIAYTGGLFPVLAVVFLLRSFLFEPFNIPTASMVPTLLVGDFILVNKFTYGIRLPLINKKIIDINRPRRGDVMVFRFPEDPSINYIKRVVGLPGDRVVYRNKRLTINGEPLAYQPAPDFLDVDGLGPSQQFTETLGGITHPVLQVANRPAFVPSPHNFPHRDACEYNSLGFACTVPPGNYFTMGDNRDDSEDSRYWGFVPDQNIVGKAALVWMNFKHLGHIGAIH